MQSDGLLTFPLQSATSPIMIHPFPSCSSTEMSIRGRKIMFMGSRARPVCRANNSTAVYEPIVETMWDP
jgi:hypothetical protein